MDFIYLVLQDPAFWFVVGAAVFGWFVSGKQR